MSVFFFVRFILFYILYSFISFYIRFVYIFFWTFEWRPLSYFSLLNTLPSLALHGAIYQIRKCCVAVPIETSFWVKRIFRSANCVSETHTHQTHNIRTKSAVSFYCCWAKNNNNKTLLFLVSYHEKKTNI